ncbi:nucleoside-diphosphate sugar epimerase/dehydratase [Palleronia sp. LCG004]|uniref:polysaccharide biosynthesis protein n=1 Tax=Palleronia sp. LCG004 TaxID=3079304 RepID=UPI0029422F95|nr:nucleoside-diphosphate sugar epimerase/dehydratase [Palleronia sp. LCG004]WOI57372.1 nucleoside-diphosphate sugar epimerase/dehydratase [Palleronia sp. LCG004]
MKQPKSAPRVATKEWYGRTRKRVSARVIGLERSEKRVVFVSVDVILTAFAYCMTLFLLGDPIGAILGDWVGLLTLALLLIMTGVTSVILKIPNIRLNAYDAKGIGWVGVLAGIVAVMAAALHRIASAPLAPATFVVFGLMLFVLLAAARLLMLEVLISFYRMQGKRCRVLIYGAGTTGMQLARALVAHDKIEPVAFVDDNPSLQNLTIAGLPVLRPVDIEAIAADRKVERVLLAMPSLSRPKQTQIARRLQAQGVEVQALPSFSQLIGQEPLVEKLVPLSPARMMGREIVDRQSDRAAREFAGRVVMVTGGGGSIGSELCRQVLGCAPKKLVIFELSELALYETEKSLAPIAQDAGVELVAVLGSITEARLVRYAIETHSVDVVLHAAAYKHVTLVEQNPLVGLANNVLGTWTLARESARAGCERFVLVSSDKAVRPTNVMGASKRLAELVVQDLSARSNRTIFSMVRFGNVIGSSGSVIPLFKDQIARGGPVTVTHRDVTRFFMTVEEAVSLVLVAGSMAQGGEVYVLDMGNPVRIWGLAEHLIAEYGYTLRDEDNPDGDIAIVEIGLKPGEKLHEELVIGEGHLTTRHEKIFCVREAALSEIEVASAIRSLREALATGNSDAAAAVAARWVEGYRRAEAADTKPLLG